MILAASQLAGYGLVIVTSLLAGVGVTAAFSLAIVGAVHAVEARRERRTAPAVGWAALSFVALVAVGIAIGAGLRILAT